MTNVSGLIREITKAKERWEEIHYTIPTGVILGEDLYNEFVAVFKKQNLVVVDGNGNHPLYDKLMGMPIEIDYKRKRRCSLTVDIDVPYMREEKKDE